MEFEPVIGLEVHVQLKTNSKIWCSCEINTHALENTRVCEICSGAPGTLPVLNKEVERLALMTGLALGCKINSISHFDRKNYFYPDLPKGYQITQYDIPLASDGKIEIEADDGTIRSIGIERIQIEEDTGKSGHEGESSLINLNRCGTPLLEIVGRPHLRSKSEASRYLKKLHSILTYLEVSKGHLQEGNFRCDVNLSLRPKGSNEFGTRTEVKNLNSFKFVEKAIEYEMGRQTEVLTRGGKVDQQTLLFDVEKLETRSMRSKAEAHDYRYFPEPDLPPLIINQKLLDEVKETLPELPDQKRDRFISEYGLPLYDAEVLTSDKAMAQYFEDVRTNYKGDAKKASNWVMVELLKMLNEFGVSIQKSPVKANDLAELLNMMEEGTISGRMAKDVFEKMFDTGKKAKDLVKAMGATQINDEETLQEMINQVLQENKGQLEQYLSGKEKLFGFFVGQTMKKSKGQANPAKTNELLKKALNNLKN